MSASAGPIRVPVRVGGGRDYEVAVGAGALGLLAGVAKASSPVRRAMIAIDTGVPASLVDAASGSLTKCGIEVHRWTLEPSEGAKSLNSFESLLGAAAEARLERSDLFVAVGGGIVCDLAGYAAASYRRGCPIVQCPTTLLSMVDASVGGKTGVNLLLDPARSDAEGGPRLLKNAVGAFHQPIAVLADVDALASLSDRDFRAGLAECVKHGLIADESGDAPLLDDTLALGPSPDRSALGPLIARHVAVKASVVASDERETATNGAGRALLNMGHTFAHAIETLGHLSPTNDPADAPLRHGEAVSLGLVAACHAGEAAGLIDGSLAEEISTGLAALGLPVRLAGLPDDRALIERMSHDKKAVGGRLRVVLPVARGRCRVIDDPETEWLAAGWASIRSS